MSLALCITCRIRFLLIALFISAFFGFALHSPRSAQAQSLVPVDTVRKFFCDAQTRRVYRSKDETKYKKIARKKARALIKTFRKRKKTTASPVIRNRLEVRIGGMRSCLRGDIPSACSAVSSNLISSSNRIVNGYVCDETSSPVVLLLLNTDEVLSYGVCSGAIIQSSPLVILTAAHCLFPSSTVNITSVTAVIGGEAFSTTAITPHPSYTPYVVTGYADVAILEFDTTTTIPPLKGFSVTEEAKSPIRHVAAGYGNTTPGFPPSGLDGSLRATDIRVIKSSESEITSDMTSKTGGICTGDSGGPLFSKSESGKWRIVGISSYLISPTDSPFCAADDLNVYASTTFPDHVNFIKQFVPDFSLE